MTSLLLVEGIEEINYEDLEWEVLERVTAYVGERDPPTKGY